MTDEKIAVSDDYPEVEGVCPACGGGSLFVGEGGYVTCSIIGCPEPHAPSRALGVNFGDEKDELTRYRVYQTTVDLFEGGEAELPDAAIPLTVERGTVNGAPTRELKVWYLDPRAPRRTDE